MNRIIEVVNSSFNLVVNENDVDIHQVDNLIAVHNKQSNELYVIDNTDDCISYLDSISVMRCVIGHIDDLFDYDEYVDDEYKHTIEEVAKRVECIYKKSNKSIVEVNEEELFDDEFLFKDGYFR